MKSKKHSSCYKRKTQILFTRIPSSSYRFPRFHNAKSAGELHIRGATQISRLSSALHRVSLLNRPLMITGSKRWLHISVIVLSDWRRANREEPIRTLQLSCPRGSQGWDTSEMLMGAVWRVLSRTSWLNAMKSHWLNYFTSKQMTTRTAQKETKRSRILSVGVINDENEHVDTICASLILPTIISTTDVQKGKLT